jgi:uroporphyrinogen decarboxylase
MLLDALEGRATPRAPFWFMRQAGRYLPEYRSLRKEAGSFLKLCFTPELAAEVTLQPVRRFNMDAAILFSDILVVPYALGQALDFVEGEGPQLGPLDIASFAYDERKLSPVFETLQRVRQHLSPGAALIGFAGAPWTIACYMINGRGDGSFDAAKQAAAADPDKFDAFIELLTGVTILYLSRQIENGADAVQLFDSWAGLLPDPGFTRWIIRPAQKIVQALRKLHPQTPVIGFPREAGGLYARYAAETGAQGIGIGYEIPMAEAVKAVPPKVCLQGNLDPALLLKGGIDMIDGAKRILAAARGRPFIFNLGHGIIKETPPQHVAELSDFLKGFTW